MTRKPLFIPLKTEYYNAFLDGTKTHELRRYGGAWTEKNIWPGRAVTLSKGYGKQHRQSGTVKSFEVRSGDSFDGTYRSSILAVYGTLDVDIACIEIELEK